MRIDYLTENFEGEDFLVADGFDDAIIGVDENSMRIIYSVAELWTMVPSAGCMWISGCYARRDSFKHFAHPAGPASCISFFLSYLTEASDGMFALRVLSFCLLRPIVYVYYAY